MIKLNSTSARKAMLHRRRTLDPVFHGFDIYLTFQEVMKMKKQKVFFRRKAIKLSF